MKNVRRKKTGKLSADTGKEKRQQRGKTIDLPLRFI